MSNPYGMPPSGPQPPVAPKKSRTGLYVGLACGCLLLVLVLVAAAGAGFWWLSADGDEEDPTSGPTTSEGPTEDPGEEPTEDPTEVTEGPIESPTEDPSEEPTSESGSSITLSVSSPEEGTTLETPDETLTTENGKFIGVAVTITNDGDEAIELGIEQFSFVATDGEEYHLTYITNDHGREIEPGDEVPTLMYADVPEDMELAEVTYTDDVGTGGQKISIPVD